MQFLTIRHCHLQGGIKMQPTTPTKESILLEYRGLGQGGVSLEGSPEVPSQMGNPDPQRILLTQILHGCGNRYETRTSNCWWSSPPKHRGPYPNAMGCAALAHGMNRPSINEGNQHTQKPNHVCVPLMNPPKASNSNVMDSGQGLWLKELAKIVAKPHRVCVAFEEIGVSANKEELYWNGNHMWSTWLCACPIPCSQLRNTPPALELPKSHEL